MPTTRQNAIDVLQAAATVLLAPGWHTKHCAAKNAANNIENVWGNKACKFCAIGAVQAATIEITPQQTRIPLVVGVALNALCTVLGLPYGTPVQSVARFNDAPSTTATMVAEAMLQAADNLRNHNHDNRKR